MANEKKLGLIFNGKPITYEELNKMRENLYYVGGISKKMIPSEKEEIQSQLTDFLKATIDFFDQETRKEKEDYDAFCLLPIWKKELSGKCISNLILLKESNEIAIFKYSKNLSKFKKGDRLMLTRYEKIQKHGKIYCTRLYECTLTKENIRENTIEVRVETPSRLSQKETYALEKLPPRSFSDIKRVLQLISKQRDSHDRIEAIVVDGKKTKTILKSHPQLDNAQSAAFHTATSEENEVCLIQGPPGTGKSYVIASIANEFCRQGKRVAISAFTHTAIDNVLCTTKKLAPQHHLFKVGGQGNSENLSKFKIENHPLVPYKAPASFILGATIHKLLHTNLLNSNLDVIIFDEASQLNIAYGFVGLWLAKKVIFVGDHKQLPPIIRASHQNEIFRKSIFEYLINKMGGTMLETCRRMHPNLAKLSSQLFYDGKVKSHPICKNQLLRLGESQPILSDSHPFLLYSYKGKKSYTMGNKQEVDIIRGIIENYVSAGIQPDDIAVIAPYRLQCRLLAGTIDYDNIMIDTVDRFQGQERKIVIFSYTTSKQKNMLSDEKADFLLCLKRLNVIITRAECKLILVAEERLFNDLLGHPLWDVHVKLKKSAYVISCS